MKFTDTLFCFFLLVGIGLTTTSCEKKQEFVPLEEFTFEGTWNLDKVETTAPLLGSQTDNEPTGTIVFNEDGTGTANYSFNAVSIISEGVPITREDSFQWTKEDLTITMTKADGSVITWTTVNEADSDFQATWTEDIEDLASIDFHAYMSK